MTAFDKKVNQIAARHGWNIEKQARAAVPCYIIAAPTYEDADFFKFLKLLDCYIYQCEEQATADTNLQKALVKTSNHLYAFAAQQNAAYNAAPWCI